jgi:hypothetical protein
MPDADAQAQRQKLFAQLGTAFCSAQSGSPDEGIAVAEAVIKDGDPQDVELFARAYNTLGVCQLKAGRNKEALHAFLHTDVLFFGDSEAHAEALYYLAGLWDKENQSERALEARNLLKSQYGGSVWAQK